MTEQRTAACTCCPEVVKANAKPSGPDNRYIGHECSCPLHWKAAKDREQRGVGTGASGGLPTDAAPGTAAYRSWSPSIRLPFGWSVFVSVHPRWKDKDGCRWHIQTWHAEHRGFVLSRLGVVR